MIPALLQVAGAALVTVGAVLIAPWLGFVVAGAFALVIGVALEVRAHPPKAE